MRFQGSGSLKHLWNPSSSFFFFYRRLAVWLWASPLTSLILPFRSPKMEVMLVPAQGSGGLWVRCHL